MRKIIFIFLLLVFSCLNLSAQSEITGEEYSIYSKILERIHSQKKSVSNLQLVILDKTIKRSENAQSPESLLKSKHFADEFSGGNPQRAINPHKAEELLKNFNEKNLNPSAVKRKFKVEYGYALISQYELNKFIIEGRKIYDAMPVKPVDELHSPLATWKPFLEKYRTDGCYSFSRVGFSKDKKLALVFVSFSNGISGSNVYYIFEKTDGQWTNPKSFGSGWII